MVTTKRQRLTESGGFADETAMTNTTGSMLGVPDGAGPATDESPFRSIFMDIAKPQNDTDDGLRTQISAPPSEPQIYTTREVVPSDRTMHPDAPARERIEIPARSKKTRKVSMHSVMPSQRTLDAAKDTGAEVEETRRAERHGIRGNITPKEKVMLLIYVIIAAVLAVAVIATGVSIASSSAKASSLASEVARKQTVISVQEADIAELTDIETIRRRAIEEMGMIYADETETVFTTVIDKVEYPHPTPHTNSFDGFCKWVSSIIA